MYQNQIPPSPSELMLAKLQKQTHWLVAFLAVSVLMLSACKKEVQQTRSLEQAKQQLSTLAEKRAYLNLNLRKGGAAIAAALKNPNFKALLMSELLAPANEENELRLSKILANPQMASYVNGSKISTAIAAFTNLDGQDWSPVLRLIRPASTDRRQNVNDNGVATEEVFAID
ncbi:MAG: hypothetical protein EAY75_07440, partial [Bacteroidetes bacterium]